jgi:S-(hydroxymethyl)glutathione dehydrogenase/alcohol dehydrogenase
VQSKLAFALQMGATHAVNAREQDPVEALQALARRGPEYVFDSVGSAVTISQALRATRPGGTAVIIGLHAARDEVPIPAGALVMGNRRLLGSFVGSMQPRLDLPTLIELYRAGKLDLDALISKRYRLEELPQAFEDMEAGRVARGVLVFEK